MCRAQPGSVWNASRREKQPRLAQQAAASCRESRKVEMALQRKARMARRKAVTAFDPAFGRQVLEVDPDRRRRQRAHRVEVRERKATAERFDHGLSGGRCRHRAVRPSPAHDVDALHRLPLARRVDVGRNAGENWQRVDEQACVAAVLCDELPREPPRDARIAVVVDDRAKYVPALRRVHGGRNQKDS